MKRQISSRKQPAASPGFPRGLELMLWAVGTALLTYGLAQGRVKKDTSEPTEATPSHVVVQSPQRIQISSPNRGWSHVETPQELFLKNTLMQIRAEKDTGKRDELLAKLVDSIAAADVPSVLNDFQTFDGNDLAAKISQDLLRRWAKLDGAAAAAWAEQLPAGPLRENALAGAAIEWANNDLSGATAWAQQLPDEAEKASAMLAVANEAVRSEPLEALRLAVELPPDHGRDDLICHSAMEWALTDAEQALAWARQIEDGRLRDQVLSGIALSWSEKDPVSAATLAVEDIPAGRVQSDAVVGIVERWVQQEPEAAAAWVEQFPAGELKNLAATNVAQLWALTDPQKAEEWQSQMIVGQ